MELKQSTVAVVKIGPFVGTTGTAITDLTIPQASVRLSKKGGNMAQKSTATACVHDEIGVYFCDLSAADTGTLGALRLDVDKSGSAALMVWHFYEIVSAQYYDAKYGTGRFEADVQEIDGASAAVAEFLNMYDGSGYAGGTIKLITTGGTVSTIAAGAIASNSFAANAITAGVIAAGAIDIATFAADTKTGNNLNVHVAKFVANSLTAGIIAVGAIDAATFAADAINAAAIAGSALVAASFATGTITAAKIASDAITAAKIADSAIDIATFASDVKTGNNLNAHVAKFTANALTAGVIAAGAIDAATFAADAIDADAIAGSALVAATFATGALAAGAASATTIANNALGASATTIADNALGASATTIAAAVWNAVAASYDTNNAFGNIINDLTEDSGGTYRFTALAVALGACSGATINAQVLDVLNVDTFAEPGQAAPGATTTIVGKVGYLYKFMRNKVTATSALIAVYNDDGSTVGQKSVISDDATTYTRGEFSTGA